MRERRIGVAIIVALLLVMGAQHAPRLSIAIDPATDSGGVEARAAVDLGATAGAILFTWTIRHLERAR